MSMTTALKSPVAFGPGDPEADAVAQAFGLSKVYGAGAAAVRALADVTVEFARGHPTAIMGPWVQASPP